MRSTSKYFIMMKVAVFLLLAASFSLPGSSAIPWQELTLVDSELQQGSLDAWKDQCVDIFRAENFPETPLQQSTNYALLNASSGQCMTHLSCVYHDCDLPVQENSEFDTDTMSLDGLDIPLYVLHPTNVEDLVAAMAFCDTHNVGISVKTSGHSYLGASMLAKTLLINMASYPKYSIDDDTDPPTSFVYKCMNSTEDETLDEACQVATSRNKTAVLRVGGGELWDEALRSVWYYNTLASEQGEQEYHIVSGAAGTVSAAGGWLASGGLSGTTGMRMFGLGVDQVLEIEMVLPDATHVRFGPSNWITNDEYLYPQTTMVSGYCNLNPVANENMWQWEACEKGFDDLWTAVRGGGGGSYGIVTAIVYQLHDKPGNLQTGVLAAQSFEDYWQGLLVTRLDIISEVIRLHLEFHIDFFWNPASLDVDEDVSNNVGTPIFSLNPFAATVMFGYDGANTIWASRWQQYITDNAATLRFLGVPEERIQNLASWAIPGEETPAYAIPSVEAMNGIPIGRIPSEPKPEVTVSDSLDTFWHIPRDLLVNNREVILPLLIEASRIGFVYVLGGNVAIGDDGLSAIPESRRQSGFLMHVPDGAPFESRVLKAIYEETGTNFPGILCHNHMGLGATGPLKSDWTKACPKSLSAEEKAEQCISIQEAVWGTELLGRLESIKQSVDSKSLLVCPGGVGYQGKVATATTSPTMAPVGTPSPTSSTSLARQLEHGYNRCLNLLFAAFAFGFVL